MQLSRWLALATVAALLLACADQGLTDVNRSPIAGLARTTGTDSAGNEAPPATDLESGYFRGRVVGQSEPAAGDDSLETAPRLAGVRVSAYPRTDGNDADPALGPLAARVTTDDDGEFALPPLTGGAYVVTFAPEASSPYEGVWVTAVAYSGSHEHAWWIVLPK